MLTQIASLIEALNSDEEPWQISLAVVFAAFVGLMPTMALHSVILIFIVLLLNINFSVFTIFVALFAIASYVLDPLFNSIGLMLLNNASLEGLWTAMYNTTFWRLIHFNNSIIMGSFFTSLILSLPLFFISQWAVKNYRDHILARLNGMGLVKMIKASKVYTLYSKVKGGN